MGPLIIARMPAIRAFALASLLGAPAPQSPPDTARLSRLIAIEDSRPADLRVLATLIDALASPDTLVVRVAARGLGRQERAELIDPLAALLTHPNAGVRGEAVNAIGQGALEARTDHARNLLEGRLRAEPDPAVRGILLRTLGRLPVQEGAGRDYTEQLLIRAGGDPEAPPEVLAGLAHGLHSLFRRTAADAPPSLEAIERLVELLDRRHPPLVRRLAMAALVASQQTDSGILLEALRDSSSEVRRLALVAAANQRTLPGRERVVRRAWRDPSPQVRLEALRAFAAHMARHDGCAPLQAALDDPDAHVRLVAIDLLGGCGAGVAPRLREIAGRVNLTDTNWHAPAHALVSLARIQPAVADSLIQVYLASPVWWAVMYAARAAEASGNRSALGVLARSRHPNVREAAIDALRRQTGHASDSLYLAALDATDYQLVRTAAVALDSSSHPRAAQAVLEALRRLSRTRSETSRDTRVALLQTLGTIGRPELASALRPFFADFDPVIAAQAGERVNQWAQSGVRPAPRPLPPARVPGWSELERLSRTSVILEMKGGGRITIRLRPFDAPTNAARLAAMAREGKFNGLTFHRVAANFVVQGGSPGANEYSGQDRFTRDERGLLSHARGTVGLSTRGRDTGDGQIFINLVDNWRLDHTYTVLGEVTEGMDVVEAMLEGAVIELARVVEVPNDR